MEKLDLKKRPDAKSDQESAFEGEEITIADIQKMPAEVKEALFTHTLLRIASAIEDIADELTSNENA